MKAWLFTAVFWLSVPALAEESTDVNPQRRLVEQKLRLVESLQKEPSSARPLIDDAKKALAVGDYPQAGRLLDEALKGASRGAAGDNKNWVNGLRELEAQISSYRNAVHELVRAGKDGGAGQVLVDQVDLKMNEAKRLEASGRLSDANRVLTEAYRQVTKGLSDMRFGQTVTQSLKFDTPADEYAYELRRYSSNEMIVSMMVERDSASPSKRMVDNLVSEGQRLHTEAKEYAQAGNYKAAVAAMEQAVGQLNRALQMLGVPVF